MVARRYALAIGLALAVASPPAMAGYILLDTEVNNTIPRDDQISHYDSRVAPATGFATTYTITSEGHDGGLAVATGDLASGALHAYASSVYLLGGAGITTAAMSETIHFVTAPGSPTTGTFVVGLTVHVDGLTTIGDHGGTNNNTYDLRIVNPTVNNNNPATVHHAGVLGFNGATEINSFQNSAQDWTTQGPVTGGLNSVDRFDFSGTFTVNRASPTITLTQSLFVRAVSGAEVDFGNTAFINFILPAGVSFTSDSGVFLTTPLSLTPPSTQVPVPGALGLLAAALAGFGILRRRHG